MFEDIPGYDKWVKIEKIERGWSFDTKYYVESEDNQKLLLRISDIKFYDKKKKEFEVISMYSKLGFKMSNPVDFGVFENETKVYMLLTWVEGEDLEIALPMLSNEEQYQIGREAGLILKKIHSLPIAVNDLPTQTKEEKKRIQILKYEQSELRIEDDEIALQYVKDNLHKIWKKLPVYQHGDFHPGNLILTKDKKLGVIDFNRWEIGDPYEEFYKLENFGTLISIPYSIGQIDAYFDDEVPNDFWEILSVYVAHSALYSIEWARPFGKKDVDVMKEICLKSFKHYNHFKTHIPIWYKKGNV
ncbi:MAG: aminoglycoside phosphotransferase [Tenericutes bacterium HGW-Tenericutes-2]|jgi:aminoglycoside phosphotransferase (APT) family kinase protein|nr:MAG: aminoglycoside phosphotransferase [Tenericutes bacterium HGW-Tenericutes-2]